MNLTLKLPLAFAAATVLVTAAGIGGILTLRQALQVYAVEVRQAQQRQTAVDGVAIAFKTQVQEWKNTLLRGKDPKALDKYWGSFRKLEKYVAGCAGKLAADLPEGDIRLEVQKFAAAHVTMGENYRKGYEKFKAAGFDPAIGDAAVAGMDREPAKLLDEADEHLRQLVADLAARADARATRATWISLTAMLGICAIVFGASMLFTRRLIRPLKAAVRMADAIAMGDLGITAPRLIVDRGVGIGSARLRASSSRS